MGELLIFICNLEIGFLPEHSTTIGFCIYESWLAKNATSKFSLLNQYQDKPFNHMHELMI